MAATSISRRICQRSVVITFEDKRTGGFEYDFSKPPFDTTHYCRILGGFYCAMQQKLLKKIEPITAFQTACYRLCVFASGSLMTEIFSCTTLIKICCLHFGQYSGKFSSIVSSRICNLVLLTHIGHNTHSHFFMPIFPLFYFC